MHSKILLFYILRLKTNSFILKFLQSSILYTKQKYLTLYYKKNKKRNIYILFTI